VKNVEIKVNGNSLKLIVGDITVQHTEAIVNAANGTLLGGGGVDGSIHKAAGPELLAECKKKRKEELQGEYLPTGQAVITKGYRLPAKYVIHTVGPVWHGNTENEEQLLAQCFRNSLELAKKHGIKSISFPAISTGVYRFPIKLASIVSMKTVYDYLREHQFGEVAIVLFTENDYEEYQAALNRILDSPARSSKQKHAF
jgi:O-acetyl-ADP-ribose deacetylase (regulator of RNase III)